MMSLGVGLLSMTHANGVSADELRVIITAVDGLHRRAEHYFNAVYTDSKATAMVRRAHAPENHRPPLHVDEDVEPLHVVNAVSSECVVVGVVLEIARVLLANPHEPCDGWWLVFMSSSEWWW
jgi:hypothetical protein